MSQLKKILLATDNSNEGASAEKYAIEFASAYNCELHFVTVFDPSANTLDDEIVFDEYIYQYKEQIENELADKFKDIVHLKSLKCFFVAYEEQGTVSATISDYAWTHNIDLIIVGSYGSSGYKRNSLGSTSYALIKASQHPVIIVPRFAEFSKSLSVVFACKGLTSEIEHCGWLISSLEIEINKLSLVHVTEDGDEEDMKRFEVALRSDVQTCEVQLEYYQGDNIVEALNSFAENKWANLFVMSGIPKSFFKQLFSASILRRMSYQIHLPLLYLPEHKIACTTHH